MVIAIEKKREQRRKYINTRYHSDEEFRKSQIEKACKIGKKRRLRMKLEIIKLLGGRCSNPNCPIPSEKMDIRCLQIDHINGGGDEERKSVWGDKYYRKILEKIKVGSREYQLLCAYCNWLKRYERNERW